MNKNIDIEDNKMTSIKFQKPFLKWVGGKTQIIKKVVDKFPKNMNNYYELFLGGGSVLLALLSLQKQKNIVIKERIYAYDINGTLINVYKHVQNNKDELFNYIELYIKEYDSITGSIINRKPTNIEEGRTSKESYYYWIRNKYNTMDKNSVDKNSVERSAIFMFINKTCFRGMYREGPNGYNVPYGHYKKTPTIISKQELDSISELIEDVVFEQISFCDSVTHIQTGDFVYLDPPYAPETDKSFVGYTKDGFELELHNKLFHELSEFDKKNIKFVMSNAKVKLVLDNCNNFNSEDIVARRAIHSKNPGSKTTEVIINN